MNPSFAYFYDDFVSEKRHEKILNEVEAEIANKNIGGRIARLAMFRNPREMMEDLIEGGAKNIVVVGNDSTLKKVIGSSQGFNPVFGYIPLGKSTEIAELLGIKQGKPSVDILAGRYIERLDIGRVRDGLFIKEVVIKSPNARVSIEGRFNIQPSKDGMMIIRNLSLPDIRALNQNPSTKKLEIEVVPNLERSRREKRIDDFPKTKLTFDHATIMSEKEMDILVDGHMMRGNEFDVELIPNRLRCITGRRLLFREGDRVD